MARYKEYSYKQTKLIPISFDHQSDLTDRKDVSKASSLKLFKQAQKPSRW